MALKVGDRLGAYTLTQDFVSTDAGNCRWSFAERDGKAFFVKEFLRPKRPPEGLPPKLRDEKLARCKRFEERYLALISAVGKVSASGGNIVTPTDFFHARNIYYLIAPRIRTETLTIAQVAALPVADKLLLLRILARAIQTIHTQKVVHCDLKPSNILIQRTDTKLYAPKLIDFDGSFFVGSTPDPEEMAFDQKYMSPEVLAYNKAGGGTEGAAARLGTACDIFSFGILIHEYWTGRRPEIPGGGDAAEAVINGKVLRLNAPTLPKPILDLLPRMLSVLPEARPGIGEIDAIIGMEVKARAAVSVSALPGVASGAMVKPPLGMFRGKLAASMDLAAPLPPRSAVTEPPAAPIAGKGGSETKKAGEARLIISRNLRPKL